MGSTWGWGAIWERSHNMIEGTKSFLQHRRHAGVNVMVLKQPPGASEGSQPETRDVSNCILGISIEKRAAV